MTIQQRFHPSRRQLQQRFHSHLYSHRHTRIYLNNDNAAVSMTTLLLLSVLMVLQKQICDVESFYYNYCYLSPSSSVSQSLALFSSPLLTENNQQLQNCINSPDNKNNDKYDNNDINYFDINRRDALQRSMMVSSTLVSAVFLSPASNGVVHAYTPDPDQLQESLYFISRVQEATVQQERFINNAIKNKRPAKELQSKLKLTLRLVEKNYKLLDQITYCSQYIQPEDKLIETSEAGYQAVEDLQSAIDFVKNDSNWDATKDDVAVTETQRDALITSLKSCREELFVFLKYVEPQEKLNNARMRVENENKDNRDEFDGDSDAGVYNPVVLPWKTT